MVRKLLEAGLVALVLAGCEKPSAPVALPPPPPPLTAARAFELAFGHAAPVERKVIRQADYEETLTYRPSRLVRMADDQVALVSVADSSSDCHACSGAMAIHYLKRTGTTWAVTGGWPEIVPGNGFGEPPEWTERRDLGDPLYIVAEAGWTGQGYTCTSVDIIELMPGAPRVLGENIPTHYDNEGVGETPVVKLDGTLGRGPDGKLRVTFTGTRSGFTDYEVVGPVLVRRSPNVIEDC